MARPKSREGRYERIALDVREDLLFWLDAFSESRRELIEEALIDLIAKKEGERMATQAEQSATLERFLASDDFRSGVISSTKASWGGGSYSVEISLDGTWTVLGGSEIGNREERSGIPLRLPTLTVNGDELEEYVEGGGGSQDAFLIEAFDAEVVELKAVLRDELYDRFAMADADYINRVLLPTNE